jgi:hypothetical protein
MCVRSTHFPWRAMSAIPGSGKWSGGSARPNRHPRRHRAIRRDHMMLIMKDGQVVKNRAGCWRVSKVLL